MNICRLVSKNTYELFKKDILHNSIISFRNTYIVKRKIPPPLSRVRAVRPRILKGRHFIYETVADTDLIEPPDVQVVLTTFVEGIGDVGDVISLIPHCAREHLLLPKKAVYATPESIEKYATIKRTRPEMPKFSSIHSGQTMRILSQSVIPVYMNSEVPWTIEKNHIQIAFRNEEFYVPEEAIELPTSPIQGPDDSKEAQDFAVYITINNAERFPVRCRLFHIKRGFETTKLPDEFYKGKADPILEEQKELLDQMPTPDIIDDPEATVSLVEKYRIQYIK